MVSNTKGITDELLAIHNRTILDRAGWDSNTTSVSNIHNVYNRKNTTNGRDRNK